MRPMSKKVRLLVAALTLVLLATALGCGSSSRNDQGVSFTFFGWFGDSSGSVGVSTLAVPIAGPNPEATGFGRDVVAYAGLQNNLLGQFIRVERIFHSYSVPGASEKIPDTSVAVPGTLGSAGDQDASTLPAGAASFGSGGNVGYFGALVVPRSVREFIALNRDAFPEPPFVMVVSSYASGVTSSGSRLDSNQLEIEVIIEPEIIIPPTEGEEDTADTGTLELDEVDDQLTE